MSSITKRVHVGEGKIKDLGTATVILGRRGITSKKTEKKLPVGSGKPGDHRALESKLRKCVVEKGMITCVK